MIIRRLCVEIATRAKEPWIEVSRCNRPDEITSEISSAVENVICEYMDNKNNCFVDSNWEDDDEYSE